MTLEQQISASIITAFEQLWNTSVNSELISLQETKKEFQGTHTLVCFPLARFSKLSPEQTGEAIGKYLKEHVPFIVEYNVVKGFLNLSMKYKVVKKPSLKILSQIDYCLIRNIEIYKSTAGSV